MDGNQNSASSGHTCERCSAPPERGYVSQLCAECRSKLARRPIPSWIYGCSAVISCLLIYAALTVPQSLHDISIYDRAQKSFRKDPEKARVAFAELLKRYPKSAEVNGWHSVVAFRLGEHGALAHFSKRFYGEKLSSELTRELNSIYAEMEDREEAK